MEESIALRNYAHIGDAVWEIFVREYTVFKTSNTKLLHKITTDRVKASFQMNMLNLITPALTEEETDLARRARNLTIPVARRSIQHDYRLATAFEVLIGFWYLHNRKRLEEIYQIIKATEFFT